MLLVTDTRRRLRKLLKRSQQATEYKYKGFQGISVRFHIIKNINTVATGKLSFPLPAFPKFLPLHSMKSGLILVWLFFSFSAAFGQRSITGVTDIRMALALSAENLLNKEWNEAQFDTETRLHHETDPVSEIHFTPGTPLFIKAGIAFLF
jgi:hypothetical protein